MQSIHTEDAPEYAPDHAMHNGFTGSERETLLSAAEILLARVKRLDGLPTLDNPTTTADFLRCKLASVPHEVFACLFLDNRHRVIEYRELFRGTVDGASVHPREVARECIELNAAAVIFAHNHPSGVAEPSAADRAITRDLREALGTLGIRVLDHIVVGAGQPVSMAARGLI